MKKQLNTFKELQEELIVDLAVKHGQTVNDKVLLNAEILFPITLPVLLSDDTKEELMIQSIFFRDCNFYDEIKLEHNSDYIFFENCNFYKNIMAYNSTFNGKVRFRNCEFRGEVNFKNATFTELADFWMSKFYKKVVFYKTDFESTVVFSSATFYENVLFTYTLIDKLIIFRGTKFKKGLDLSLAIFSGKLSVFDILLKDFKTSAKYLDDSGYENLVNMSGDIPIKNKRETFRILKKYFENNNNVVESLPFKVSEKKTLLKEQFHELFRFNTEYYKEKGMRAFLTSKVRAVFNLFVLLLNIISNYFGVAYIQSALFTLAVGGLFFYLTILNSEKYVFAYNWDWNILRDNIAGYANFLIPTHKFNFLGEGFLKTYKLSNWFYVFDIAGRIAIGYGIYQTIQAFRKFR
ncbi:pentapeptide repeat-containing protein [Aquimarina muelleri]|uniref:pentapeptide repeat-containing protein n=1 Tax=Aquimarina muelleri TaxID=279356 RepID=UPI003F6870DA